MSLTLCHIGDLRDMYFNIPDYQRGYRWETKQIVQLLDDLFEFARQNPKTSFYCLQPLVVVESCLKGTNGEPVLEVIDGQQRLTTLFLLYHYLFHGEPYHLRYERACSNPKAGGYADGQLDYAQLQQLTSAQIAANPDYFYLSKAMKDIKEWFTVKKESVPGIERLMQDVLLPPTYVNRTPPFYTSATMDANANATNPPTDPNAALNDARFIWYDASVQSQSYQSSIDVFKRLNYGKTSLTATDLIKALLLQCDVYGNNKAQRREVAMRISLEWDKMEKALNNPFVASMLSPSSKEQPHSSLDFLFTYLAERIRQEHSIALLATRSDSDYNYLVLNRYFEQQLAASKDYASIVDTLWVRVQDVYDMLMSWYEDHELYHLIGLRLLLLNPKPKSGIDNTGVLHQLFEDFKGNSIGKFKQLLRKEIGAAIKLGNDPTTKAPRQLSDLAYGEDNDLILKILLVHNVTLTMRNGQDAQRFPFWWYRQIVPSLEHIHPQHLNEENIKTETLQSWYADKKKALQEMPNLSTEKHQELDEACQLLDPILQTSTPVKAAEKEFKAKETECRKALSVIDHYFDELANIDEASLHNISNMALIDQKTNAALGNGLMSDKRKRLAKVHAAFNRTQGEEGAYVFPGTWRVFHYEFATSASSFHFWGKEERARYLNELQTIYQEYVP